VGLRFPVRRCPGKVADTDVGRIGGGLGVEPEQLPIAYGSTSRTMRRCASATKPLPVALRARPWGSAPRADRLSAHWAGIARATGANPRTGKSFIVPEIIDQRAPRRRSLIRVVPGPLGRDLIPGLDSSAIARWWSARRRFTMLLHLPRMAEHGVDARVKNGPALAGHGAEAVRDSITGTITSLPEQLRRVADLGSGGRRCRSMHG